MVVNSSHCVSKVSSSKQSSSSVSFFNWTLADLLSVRIYQTVDPLGTRVYTIQDIFLEMRCFFFPFKGKEERQ